MHSGWPVLYGMIYHGICERCELQNPHIRARTFLLLVITAMFFTRPIIPYFIIGAFWWDAAVILTFTLVLCLNKEQSEFLSSGCVYAVLILWAGLIPATFFLKICTSTGMPFEDTQLGRLWAAAAEKVPEIDRLNYFRDFMKEGNCLKDSFIDTKSTVISIIFILAAQRYLCGRYCKTIEFKKKSYEANMLTITTATPVIVMCLLTWKKKIDEVPYYVQLLPVIGIGPILIAIFCNFIEIPGTPDTFCTTINLKYLKKSFLELGIWKTLTYIVLLLKLKIKSAFFVNGAMSVLRFYWLSRLIETIIEEIVLKDVMSYTEMLILPFCKDYFCVIGSTSIIPFFMKYLHLGSILLEINYQGHHLDQFAQAIVPGTYLILNMYNAYAECRSHQRIVNCIIILCVTAHSFFLPMLALTWRIAAQQVNFNGIKYHMEVYICFFFIAVIPHMLNILTLDYFSAFTGFILYTMSLELISLAVIGTVSNFLLFIYGLYVEENDSVQSREDRLHNNHFLNYIAEVTLALYIYDQTSRPIYFCNTELYSSPTEILNAIGLVNLFNTAFYSGFYNLVSELQEWESLKRILSKMKPPLNNEYDENENCTMCDDAFGTDPVSKSPCGHIFHAFCIREWFDVSDACPQCNTNFAEDPIKELYSRLLPQDFEDFVQNDWNKDVMELVLNNMAVFDRDIVFFSEEVVLKNVPRKSGTNDLDGLHEASLINE